MIKNILYLVLMLLFVSCHTQQSVIVTKKSTNNKPIKYPKKTTNPTNLPATTNEYVYSYIEKYKEVAMNNMKSYGIPASIILAQGILESGAGKGSLAINANNHFGIKCHNDWKGEAVYQDDDAAQECFRKYNDPAESYRDHAIFLTGRNRYANLFHLPKDDYESWAKGLKSAGYATDPGYPEKLIGYINRYELYRYDSQVLGHSMGSDSQNRTKNETQNNFPDTYYEIQKGDTLYSISKKFNLTIDDLKEKNNLMDNNLIIGQKIRIK